MKEPQLEYKAQGLNPYEDEIRLMDLLEILWKWKYLALIGTLLCAAVGAVVSFQMTKLYG